ncbi:unnamed protein product [Closterium sp. Naga37s-1]|nr:unnamed protein product [Closterium sp. Naga37s-1]
MFHLRPHFPAAARRSHPPSPSLIYQPLLHSTPLSPYPPSLFPSPHHASSRSAPSLASHLPSLPSLRPFTADVFESHIFPSPHPHFPCFSPLPSAPSRASLPSQQARLSRTSTDTPPACLSLLSLPPFTAGAFESHVNRLASRLPVPVFRSYGTGLPENLFHARAGMAREGGMVNKENLFHTRSARTTVLGLPPFTAGAFESHVNRHASRLPVPVFRSYDTGLPEALFAAVEDIAAEGGAVNMRYKDQSRYHIWIADTELDIEYKVICVPDPDNSGIILTKVKHNSLRYAVVDIARPSKAIDFRLLLLKESRLCSLDTSFLHPCSSHPSSHPSSVSPLYFYPSGCHPDATRSACELITSTAVIDRSARGGLLWPDITTGFDTTLLSSSSASASPSPPSAAATAPTSAPAPSSQSVSSSPPPTRFRVMGCWHLDKSRAESGGRLWKLARINGLVAGQVGSSLKHQIDLCPLAWRETTKGHEGPSNSTSSSPVAYSAASCFDSSLQQAAPQWTPDSILADCPALINWLQEHLP